jgi:hypothetical protein
MPISRPKGHAPVLTSAIAIDLTRGLRAAKQFTHGYMYFTPQIVTQKVFFYVNYRVGDDMQYFTNLARLTSAMQKRQVDHLNAGHYSTQQLN